MRRDDLFRMANQIACFFEAYPPETASAEVGKHLKSFWDPRMRRQLLEFAADSADGLHPLVRQAMQALIPDGNDRPAGKA